jgi:2-keto-4-pentenoate hydratase/2-oxohepta-3-ene-1,7-dioic acid hydratase in catechol pathway
MDKWIRFEHQGKTGFGKLNGDSIAIQEGDLFGASKPTGQTVALSAVHVLAPVQPGKIIGLWNNFHQLAAKLNLQEPPEPLYFIKSAGSVTGPGAVIKRPKRYDGKVVFEGELGVVIGKTCSVVSEADAPRYILGYTCCNDVTAAEMLKKHVAIDGWTDWTRAKSFDTFGPIGPVIVSGLDPAKLVVRSILAGQERQNYPVSDMLFGPHQLVSLISQDMTLNPGDIISCGTSVGVGSMKPGSTIEISIDGIGSLSNTFE